MDTTAEWEDILRDVNLRLLADASGVDYNTLRSIRSGRVPGTSKRAAIAEGLRMLGRQYIAAADTLDPPSPSPDTQQVEPAPPPPRAPAPSALAAVQPYTKERQTGRPGTKKGKRRDG